MRSVIRNAKKIIPQSAKNYFRHYPVALTSNLAYGWPSRKLKVIGVSGTDGKTTTVNMIYQILKAAGKKCSMISTINAVIGDKKYDTGFHVTSPDPKMVQKFISQAVLAGSEYIVLEVTSHGLDQGRFLGINFLVGVITNVTHEHLDYHKSFQNYLEAKSKLIKRSKWAILNADDPSFGDLKAKAQGQVISFGLSEKADWTKSSLNLKLKILGDYNQSNALAAAAATSILGIDHQVIKTALESFTSLAGRMEEIPNKSGLRIIVDFAHTPNALAEALTSLKKTTKGCLIAVFGAASERDESKRPMMGQVASKLADKIILTDEDPRFELSIKIIDEIAAGATGRAEIFKQPDRLQAIKLAISLASKGDTVAIFGKGHEQSQSYFGKERPWSDQAAVLKVLKWIKR